MTTDFVAHYEAGVEAPRLDRNPIELLRTLDVLARWAPPPPARVLDVGGGPGTYADRLAAMGYDVTLHDPVPLHVEQARARAAGRFEASDGDARSLPEDDGSADVVLLLGPLYHLTDRDDRLAALRETRRVLRPGGIALVAAVSRFASLHDGMRRGWLADPDFAAIVDRDLTDGQHRNPTAQPQWFTTAFFHHPDELAAEVTESGLELRSLVGVEGATWLVDGVEPTDVVLDRLRQVETERALLGVSAHLLAVASAPEGVD